MREESPLGRILYLPPLTSPPPFHLLSSLAMKSLAALTPWPFPPHLGMREQRIGPVEVGRDGSVCVFARERACVRWRNMTVELV